MRRKKWRGSKSVLPLLLSAMMVVEPLGSAITVHAEEIAPLTMTEELEQEESTSEGEALPDSGEEVKEDTDNSAETDEDQADNSQETGQDPTDESKDEDDSSDTEDQETDENVPSEDDDVSETELEEESVSENDLEEEEDGNLDHFSDMPAGYQLNAAQRAEKEILAGEVKNINAEDEGVLYAKRQIMVEAGSREEAEMIAEAYNAKILGFENGILLLELQKNETVVNAVMAAASTRNRLPAVWPNYYRYPHAEEMAVAENSDMIQIEETEYEVENDESAVYAEEEDIPTLEEYGNVAFSYNDPALSSADSHYQWQHVAVGSTYAWAANYTGSGIKVAILDTGVKNNHEDLVIAGEANTTGTSVTTGTGKASDDDGHGTHVAGIIGARKNNGKGGVGIAPDATLYAVNVLSGGTNAGTDWAIIQGIEQARKWQVDIINMSLGGIGYNQLCQDAVTEAYNEGIAIFVSAGNDGVSRVNYPAHYDHVICVAAVDPNNTRADFSTYGSWVDLSAPGVGIWSSYNNGGYYSMDGTSQACPVAAGEAAVILAGDASLKSMAKNSARVDALEKKMKSNVVKVSGSGMGAGVTSLTKVFKLSTATVKPQAPTIDIVPDDKSKAQKVTVTIKAQGGMRIYYTDNGKNPVDKRVKDDDNTKTYSNSFSITGVAKGAIKAIAVNESGVASPVKSVNFTLKPNVSSIKISGVDKVVAGKSIQLTAEVLPAYAANKKLDWKLYTAAGREATAAIDKISISTSGKVTAKAGVAVGAKFKVRATAKDGTNQYDEYEITVIENTKIKTAVFESKSLTLEIPKETNRDLGKLLKAEFADGTAAAVTDFKWSSSNTTIATVNANGVIQPSKAGKVTITALANDSSGKKATCTVTVKQLVTGIRISGPSSVAAGKAGTFKAEITPANATVNKVTWSVIDNATNEVAAASTGVSINKSNGKLSTKATSRGTYTVKAVATDGSGKENSYTVKVNEGAIKTIAFDKAADKKVTIFRKAVNTATKTSATVAVKIEGTNEQANLSAYEVKNSNPGIATVSDTRSGNMITLTINATGYAAGKTNITLAATDGSGKKVTCVVNVNNPVTKVHISSSTKTASGYRTEDGKKIDMTVVKGKSIQLKATLESEYGKISNKGVKWSIDVPSTSGITLSNSGKVSAKKNIPNYICTVTAEAADGGGAKATYNIGAVDPTTILAVPQLVSGPGTIWYFHESDVTSDEDGKQGFLPAQIVTDVMGGYVDATSSNPKAMEVLVWTNPKGVNYLMMSPKAVKKDTVVTITVKVTDGSGKKVSYKVLVKK